MAEAKRYKASRQCIRWERDNLLSIAKMLAWILKYAEARSGRDLWTRFEDLYPKVTHRILGDAVSLKQLQEHTMATQGLEITPNKLMQRADKTERNGEFNKYKDDVEEAYEHLTRTKVT